MFNGFDNNAVTVIMILTGGVVLLTIAISFLTMSLIDNHMVRLLEYMRGSELMKIEFEKYKLDKCKNITITRPLYPYKNEGGVKNDRTNRDSSSRSTD